MGFTLDCLEKEIIREEIPGSRAQMQTQNAMALQPYSMDWADGSAVNMEIWGHVKVQGGQDINISESNEINLDHSDNTIW